MRYKRLLTIMTMTILAGCSKPKPPQLMQAQPAQAQPSETQVYAELRRVCNERHLSYKVYCVLRCQAEAWDSNLTFEETNRENYWSWLASGNGPTDAAKNLIEALKHDRNWANHGYGGYWSTGEVKPQ